MAFTGTFYSIPTNLCDPIPKRVNHSTDHHFSQNWVSFKGFLIRNPVVLRCISQYLIYGPSLREKDDELYSKKICIWAYIFVLQIAAEIMRSNSTRNKHFSTWQTQVNDYTTITRKWHKEKSKCVTVKYKHIRFQYFTTSTGECIFCILLASSGC